MQYLDLNGDRFPALGFGTFELQGKECYDAVRHALDVGYRHVDTAEMYENEEQVGKAIADSGVPREEVFVTTKVWWENLRPRQASESLAASLRKLGTDYVDLWLIHWPNADVPLEETLQTMTDLRQGGKVRQIGVSNFTPPLVERAAELAPIVCNQVEYHPFLGQDQLLSVLRQRNLVLTAYSPLAQGKVTADPTLREIGEKHGKTPAQVTLRWQIDQGRVATIPRSSSAEHREQNFDVFDFELSPGEMERISNLARGERLIDPGFAPDWGETTATAAATA